MQSDPTMMGRIFGLSSNRLEKFIADTGTSVAIKWTVTGHTEFFVKFKSMRSTNNGNRCLRGASE